MTRNRSLVYADRVSRQLSSPRQVLKAGQAEKLSRLLEAAGELLEEMGHEQMTVRMVAARAGVAPATAYTYFSSKDHLFAEMFWRLLDSSPTPSVGRGSAARRVERAAVHLTEVICGSPALAAAVTKSLLGSDPEVERCRRSIGALWVQRFGEALGDQATGDLVETLTCAFTGALLEAGMGIRSYGQLPEQVGRMVRVIMTGPTRAARRAS
jgi:AcrR family transcriptional regulator